MARCSSATRAPSWACAVTSPRTTRQTGRKLWRFFTVPGDAVERLREQRDGDGREDLDGRMVEGRRRRHRVGLDCVRPEAAARLYLGVGNGSPWVQKFRSPGGGDNLFLASIVAVKADTGEYVWHYQESPGEEWDYTATQHMILADLKIDGRVRQVLMQAPKNGFFYVLDRRTGELLSADAFLPTQLGVACRSEVR